MMSSHTSALRSDVVSVFRPLLSKVLCVCGRALSNSPVSTRGICSPDDLGFIAAGGGFFGVGVCSLIGTGINLSVGFGTRRFVSLATSPVLTGLVDFVFPVTFTTGF